MFSGIVVASGEVVAAGSGRLVVSAPELAERLGVGDSVAVDGACLTVAELTGGGFAADVMPETLHRTILGRLQPGDRVNLEPALTLGDAVGGHLVTGHVDAVGTVTALREDGNARWATIDTEPDLAPLIAEKGSVAVDGISLTVVDVFDSAFTVSLIPHTLMTTTAGRWTVGSRVNIEVDLIARYVRRAVEAHAQPTHAARTEA